METSLSELRRFAVQEPVEAAREIHRLRAENERLRGTLVGIRLLHLSGAPSWKALFGEAQELIAAALAKDALADSPRAEGGRVSFWDDLGAETVREHRQEPDTGNVDDGLSMRDRDVYARELALDEQAKEDS